MPSSPARPPTLAECLSQNYGHTTLFAVVILVVAWLGATALRAIFGEYLKRWWFSRVHPDEITKAKDDITASKVKLSQEAAELASFRGDVTRLVKENSSLKGEIIKLKIENGELLRAAK